MKKILNFFKGKPQESALPSKPPKVALVSYSVCGKSWLAQRLAKGYCGSNRATIHFDLFNANWNGFQIQLLDTERNFLPTFARQYIKDVDLILICYGVSEFSSDIINSKYLNKINENWLDTPRALVLLQADLKTPEQL